MTTTIAPTSTSPWLHHPRSRQGATLCSSSSVQSLRACSPCLSLYPALTSAFLLRRRSRTSSEVRCSPLAWDSHCALGRRGSPPSLAVGAHAVGCHRWSPDWRTRNPLVAAPRSRRCICAGTPCNTRGLIVSRIRPLARHWSRRASSTPPLSCSSRIAVGGAALATRRMPQPSIEPAPNERPHLPAQTAPLYLNAGSVCRLSFSLFTGLGECTPTGLCVQANVRRPGLRLALRSAESLARR